MKFKTRLTISLIATSFIISTIIVGVIWLGNDIRERAGQIKKTRNEVITRAEIDKNLSSLKEDFKQVVPVQAALDGLVPTKDELLGFPQDIETRAKDYGIKTTMVIGNETPRTATSFGKTEFTLSAEGSLEETIAFLNALERGKYFIKITYLNVTELNGVIRADIRGYVLSF